MVYSVTPLAGLGWIWNSVCGWLAAPEPAAPPDNGATPHRQRAQRLVDVLGDAALGAEYLPDLFAAGFDAGLGRERILLCQRLREGLVHLCIPHLVQFGLRGLHRHGIALDQRTHQQRAQRFALRPR